MLAGNGLFLIYGWYILQPLLHGTVCILQELLLKCLLSLLLCYTFGKGVKVPTV